MPPILGQPTLKQRFAAHLTGKAPGEPPLLSRPGTPELLGLQGQAADLCARAQTPRFSTDLRAQLQAKSSSLVPELLLLCARGLAARAAFARKLGVDEGACKEPAAQLAALSRLSKGAGDVYELAGAGAAQVAVEAEAGGEQVLAAAEAYAADPAVAPAARIAVEDAFAEPRRLRAECDARIERRADRKERRLRPLRDALAEARSGTAEAKLIDRYLAAEAAGKQDE
jgi:hypothetical protein